MRTRNENRVHFAAVALGGARYAADSRFGNMTLRGGASVAQFESIAVDAALAVTERSLLTHAETIAIYQSGIEITAGTLSIDATTSIDASACGYLRGGRVRIDVGAPILDGAIRANGGLPTGSVFVEGP